MRKISLVVLVLFFASTSAWSKNDYYIYFTKGTLNSDSWSSIMLSSVKKFPDIEFRYHPPSDAVIKIDSLGAYVRYPKEETKRRYFANFDENNSLCLDFGKRELSLDINGGIAELLKINFKKLDIYFYIGGAELQEMDVFDVQNITIQVSFIAHIRLYASEVDFRAFSTFTDNLDIIARELIRFDFDGCLEVLNLELQHSTQKYLPKIQIETLDGSRVGLRLDATTIDHIDFDYQKFFLKPSLYTSEEWKLPKIYDQLVDHQTKWGYRAGKKLVDKERIRYSNLTSGNFGYIKDVISEWWWDYGYDKERIFINSLNIMLIFCMFNLIFYQNLVTSTYPIVHFKNEFLRLSADYPRFHPRRIISTLFQSLMYTAALFWGIKLDLGQLSVRNIPLALLIVFQYAIGIICLAYIANYIIIKS